MAPIAIKRFSVWLRSSASDKGRGDGFTSMGFTTLLPVKPQKLNTTLTCVMLHLRVGEIFSPGVGHASRLRDRLKMLLANTTVTSRFTNLFFKKDRRTCLRQQNKIFLKHSYSTPNPNFFQASSCLSFRVLPKNHLTVIIIWRLGIPPLAFSHSIKLRAP